jgi:hypothetical protein
MARPLDPYRTLELPRDATLDDVKAAYRRLAKQYHPDSAGERALPRFLAVQAAYESLTEGPGRLRAVIGGRARSTPASSTARTASAGPSARTARESADAGTTRPAGSGARASRTGSPGRSGSTPGAGTRAGARTGGAAGPEGGAGGSSRPRGTSGPRPRRTKRAPGSTSYDGAETEPFEPEWGGASWYGGSSGTYWTINPREFADPRKHGPEYLARGRAEEPAGPTSRGSAARPTADAVAAGDAAAPDDRASGRDDPITSGGRRTWDVGWEDPLGASAWPNTGTPDPWAGPPDGRRGSRNRPEVSPFGLIAMALIGLALVSVPFALMAEPGTPGTSSVVPVVALCGIAILALVRVLRSDRRPRA